MRFVGGKHPCPVDKPPLTAGVVSKANTIQKIILEIEKTTMSERSGRLIDFQKNDSMEKKKKEGYF